MSWLTWVLYITAIKKKEDLRECPAYHDQEGFFPVKSCDIDVRERCHLLHSNCFFSTLNGLLNIMNSRELAMKQVSYLSDDLADFSQKCKSAQAKHSQSSTVPSTHSCNMARIYPCQFISWEDSCWCRKRERALKQGNDYKKKCVNYDVHWGWLLLLILSSPFLFHHFSLAMTYLLLIMGFT